MIESHGPRPACNQQDQDGKGSLFVSRVHDRLRPELRSTKRSDLDAFSSII